MPQEVVLLAGSGLGINVQPFKELRIGKSG